LSVKAKSKEALIKKVDETHFLVRVKEPPKKGKANAAVKKTLANYFGTPQSHVILIAGTTSMQKIYKLLSPEGR